MSNVATKENDNVMSFKKSYTLLPISGLNVRSVGPTGTGPVEVYHQYLTSLQISGNETADALKIMPIAEYIDR